MGAGSSGAGYTSISCVRTGSGDGALAFGTGEAFNPIERMRITAAGNVGIGTTSPQNTLDVHGNTGIYQRNSAGGRIVFDDTDTADASTPMSYIDNTAGALQFGRANRNASTGLTTGSAESMRIDSTGNVGIGTSTPDRLLDIEGTVPAIRLSDTSISGLYHELVGDGNSLSIEADDGNVGAGSAIIFKVDGSEKARITTNGLTFNGDTAAANALDDYEEGTWSPVYEPTGGTFTTMTMSSTGVYTKIGRMVFVHALIQTSDVDITGGSGSVRIGGLPFTSGAGFYSAGSIGSAINFVNAPLYIASSANSSQLLLAKSQNPFVGLAVADLTTGATASRNQLYMMAVYNTAT